MVFWFDERFITREEHEKILAHHRKLIMQLEDDIRELQVLAHAQAKVIEYALQSKRRPAPKGLKTAGNVIHHDFQRPG